MNSFPTNAPLHKLEIGHEDIVELPGTYTLDKPHPGYGKDPRILNQLGHSSYPKMIYPWGKLATDDFGKFRCVRAESEEEEAKWMADPEWQSKQSEEKSNW